MKVIPVHVPFVITDDQLKKGLDSLDAAPAEGAPAR